MSRADHLAAIKVEMKRAKDKSPALFARWLALGAFVDDSLMPDGSPVQSDFAGWAGMVQNALTEAVAAYYRFLAAGKPVDRIDAHVGRLWPLRNWMQHLDALNPHLRAAERERQAA